MATKHMVKCKYCGKPFDANKEPFIYIESSRRYAHASCGDDVDIEVVNLEKDKDTLAAYLKEAYGDEVYKDPKTWVVIGRYYNQKLTPIGIYNTLVYMHDIKKVKVGKGKDLLGLIPYYYKEATKYFEQTEKIQKINETKVEQLDENVIEIIIKSPQRKKKKKKLFSFLDEEEING